MSISTLKDYRTAGAALALASALALATFLPSPALAATEKEDAATGIQKIYEKLKQVELDATQAVPVENLQVGFDAMDITLESGKIWFGKPWREGRKPTAAFFVGKGTAKLTPVNDIEKHQFENTYGKEAMDETFEHAFIRFGGDLWDNLKDGLVGDPAPDDVVKMFDKQQKALEDLLISPELFVIEDLISEKKRNGGRFIEFETKDSGWISYAYQPAAINEHTLFKHERVGLGDFQSQSLYTTWHDKADYERGGDMERENKDLIAVQHYDGDFTVYRDGLRLEADVKIDFKSLVDDLSAVRFSFITWMDFARRAKPFTVKTLTLEDGTPLEYIHDNYQLLVQFDKPMAAEETKSIRVTYDAEFIEANPGIGSLVPPNTPIPANWDAIDSDAATFSLLNTFPWFPQYGYLARYTLDWRIKVPKPYVAVGSGTTVKRWEEGDFNCLHTVETENVALASWLFGRYITYTDEDDDARPRIYVHALPKQHKQMKSLYGLARNVIDWYEQWANPFPYDELDIAQMGFFYGFGQAPPGLVQLTGETFLSQGEIADMLGGNPRFKYAFMAHEVGHEWFGHVVSWASSHDQWLSEAYTEYMSGLYVANYLGEKSFDNERKNWKMNADSVPDGGVIWLGGRNGRHYTAVTYNKGPLVLHMLRMTMQAQFGVEKGNQMFFTAMKAFLDKFRHGNATTNEFVDVVNQTTKTDYSGFFDQWFRGWGIPEIEFSYDVRPTEDGKYLVTIRAKQNDEENVKQLLLPVEIHFGGKNVVVRMVPLTEQESVYKMKVPQKPRKVIANPNNDALVKVKS